MNRQTAHYAEEFDESVGKYNEWLASLLNPKVQRRNWWGALFRGVDSVSYIFGSFSDLRTFGYNHPLYSRHDLTPEQKDVIAIASDLQRFDNNLDRIISGDLSNGAFSVEDAKARKQLVQSMYNHFRDVYVSHTMR